MLVKDFLEDFNKLATAQLQIKYIKDHLQIKSYISFEKKCDIAYRVTEHTMYEKDNEGNKTGNLKLDSPARYLLFTLSFISCYSSLEIDFTNILYEYDLLKSSGLLDKLINKSDGIIPYTEYDDCLNILNMVMDDIIQNKYSTQAFVSSQVTRIGTLLGISLSPVLSNINKSIENLDEEKLEKLGKTLAIFADKIIKV